MRRVPTAFAALLALTAPFVSYAASAAAWPDALAAIFAGLDASNPDSTHLAQILRPAIVLGPAKCSAARLPSAASPAPITNAVIAFGDDQACDAPTPLALMEFYIDAGSADPIGQLRAGLARRLGHPCFEGQLPTDPRRRAPPRSEIAWKTRRHVVTLVQEAGAPKAAALAAVATALPPGPGVTAGYGTLRADYVAGLPMPCR